MFGRTTRAVLILAVVRSLGGAPVAFAQSGAAPMAPRTAGGEGRPAASTVRIAAAADLRFALAQIAQAFRVRSPGVRVDVTYGSSGTFHAQIVNGAPYDLFLSADLSYPRDLVARGRGEVAGSFVYALGRIVLWVPSTSPLDVAQGMDVMKDSRIRHVAIANPLHAPYGKAAEAAMRKAGVWDTVSPKLVLGENISQAAQFVQAGAADIGVIARSLALAAPMRAAGRYWDIPPGMYPPMEQAGLVLSSASNPDAARRFRDFMLGDEARAILTESGFVLPGR